MESVSHSIMYDWEICSRTMEHQCVNKEQLNEIEDAGDKINGILTWMDGEDKQKERRIKGVRINPEININIISSQVLLEKNLSIRYREDRCEVIKDEIILIWGQRIDDRYVIRAASHPRVKEKTEEGNKVDTIVNELEDNSKKREKEEKIDENFDLQVISCSPEDINDIKQLSPIEQELWKEAMDIEMKNLKDSGVIEESRLEPGAHKIRSRWTFSVKYDVKNQVKAIRARLVAKGCGQIPGEEYGDTFAPVVNPVTVRLLLAIAINSKHTIVHCDISSAFLYGQLEETIYMESPQQLHSEEKKIFKLHKAMYGLKQAAKSWNSRIDQSLKQMNFKNNLVDPCLYIKEIESDILYIIIHVDDILISGRNIIEINLIVRTLSCEYKVKNLGPVKQYLGICLEYSFSNVITHLHQRPMILRLLDRYAWQDIHISHTPMSTDYLNNRSANDSPEMPNNILYQQVIGSLLFLGNMSRPDIHLAVNLLSRFSSKPTQMDWEGVKRVIRYLKGTMDYALKIGGGLEHSFNSYCDADWGGDPITRRSTSGHLHYFGNSLIHWKTTKQRSVALSTAEAEFVAASIASQTIVWILELFNEMKIRITRPIQLQTDSQSGQRIAEAEKCTRRAKHIEIKYFYLQELIKKGEVTLNYCPGDQMIADIFTKPLPRHSFTIFRKALGMESLLDAHPSSGRVTELYTVIQTECDQ